uniref:Uncharacterized protein n=1 Tax=Fagus sylvatica TaxID=28930 RepID=A0A2N9IYI1_FAGSY
MAEIISGRGEQISRGEADRAGERQVGSEEGQISPRWLEGAELGRRVPDQGRGRLGRAEIDWIESEIGSEPRGCLTHPRCTICALLEACIHTFFDELRNPNIRLPHGRPLPPLFNFKPQELKGATLELLSKLIPEHARKQCPFLVGGLHPPIFYELRDPNIRLPHGRPLPPLFNFKPQDGICRAERSNLGASFQTDTRACPKAVPLSWFVDFKTRVESME